MYRKPKFLEVLHEVREQMSREADYDVELFSEMIRSGQRPGHGPERNVRGFRSRPPRADEAGLRAVASGGRRKRTNTK